MKHYKTFKELFFGTQIFLISSNNFMNISITVTVKKCIFLM